MMAKTIPFLCGRDLFNDLILCFDLKSHLQSSAGLLVLWVINPNDVVVHGLTMPCVSVKHRPIKCPLKIHYC